VSGANEAESNQAMATEPREATTAEQHEALNVATADAMADVAPTVKQHESAQIEEAEALQHELEQAERALPAPSALEQLCAAFSLSPFERDVLLLCAGVELDTAFAELCARAQTGARCTYPTFSLALAALASAHWSALTPDAPLRRWRLIEVESGRDALVQSRLRIDERVLHALAGVAYLDERLRGLLEVVPVPASLPPSQFALVERIATFWVATRAHAHWPLISLCGHDGAGKRAVAAAAAAALGFNLHALRTADLPPSAAEREALARLWEREAVLQTSALLLEQTDAETTTVTLSFIETVRGLLFIAGREVPRPRGRTSLRLDVHKPSVAEQQQLWQHALGPLAEQLNGQLDTLTAHFSLSAEAIQAASMQARTSTTSEADDTALALWDACRVQARARLDDLAQRIEPCAAWPDLVLPEHQLRHLRDITAHVRQRAQVYERWGFAAKGARGLGISALFAGASGTGKTLAAEILANELRLDLYRIDLSQVVNKYIGETEKNLRRVFDAAEESGAVLLFDEADALFGKRSEVKDSHDRYANIEVSYLLQRMEAYRGLAILTTNLKTALDTAFLRRLRFIVQFPFPDAMQRAEIWRRIFPAETPLANLDINKLARLNIAGGNIRNIALHAAFLAADEGAHVTMSHLLRAARSEYAKLEKPLTETESGGWL
ncbi:MAG TPA: ATP-binding protein, partial [Pyrinomonadaceae bacterium]|nr:ATP-binding protein [Pyrinomonadaceae bacterium]